jgi:hypothetical protein
MNNVDVRNILRSTSDIVRSTGDQTIQGRKTFAQNPCTTQAPQSGVGIVNRDWVDNSIVYAQRYAVMMG